MAYCDELSRDRVRPRQASLRRAVSSAYYAVFHMLVADACRNWKLRHQRTVLERAFEHGRMRQVSDKVKATASPDLKAVAAGFVKLQHLRHRADYDNSAHWTRSDSLEAIKTAEDIFETWRSIRDQPEAQDYLLAFLVKDR